MRSSETRFSPLIRRISAAAVSFAMLSGVGAMMATEASGATTPEDQSAASNVECKDHYIVQPGDTLINIAAKYQVDWQKIAQANDINDPNFIEAYRSICIPK